jgi:hypothetical protein
MTENGEGGANGGASGSSFKGFSFAKKVVVQKSVGIQEKKKTVKTDFVLGIDGSGVQR